MSRTKVIYLEELHKIYLLQLSGVCYHTVIYLIDAYMARFNILYHRGEYETTFMQLAHDAAYYDFNQFCVLCEIHMDFADAGTLHERVTRQLKKEEVIIVPDTFRIAV